MIDYRTLHEDDALESVLKSMGAGSGKLVELLDGARNFIKGKKDSNPSIITNNIAKSTRALTAVFPVIVSKAVDIEKAVMVSKAVERKCVGMLQMLFAANQVVNAKNAQEYLRNFHGNITSSIDLSNMDIDDFLQATEEDVDVEAHMNMVKQSIDIINEDVKKNIHYTLSSDINPPINDIRVVAHEAQGSNIFTNNLYGARASRMISRHNTEKSVDARTGKLTKAPISRDSTEDINEFQGIATRDWKDATDTLAKQVLDSDIRKANEAQPSLMVINFISTSESERQQYQNTCVIGVKAVIHYVDPQDIVNRVILKKSDSRGLFNLIRATTREISFFKDFLFSVNRAKVDAIAKSGKGSTDKIWKLLELRADRLKGAKVTQQSQAANAAISTLVISKSEVDYIKQFHRIDLSKPGTIKGILRGYNMMAAAIVDDVTERVDFLWDDGSNDFESLSFMSLEREENGSMYKKVINLATRGR